MVSDKTEIQPRQSRPTYSVKIIPRQYSVVVFDGPDSVNYVSSCQVFRYGDVGCMYTINGGRFYDALADRAMLETLMGNMGVSTLEGYVTKSHARLMRIMLRDSATVEIRHTGQMAGHEMVWVVVRLK